MSPGPTAPEDPSPAVVITGTPGVGKSTVCRALAARLSLAAHVEADVLQRMVVAGGQWPASGTDASFKQLLLRTANAAVVAANFVRAGIPTFLDEVVSTPEQLRLIEQAVPHARFVVLVADDHVVLERDRLRSKHTAGQYLSTAPAILDLVRDAVVVDSTTSDVPTTVQQVLDALA